MVDEETTKNIERLASATVIKVSIIIPSISKEKSKTAQKELMKLRLAESLKLKEYPLKVYETFNEQRF